MESKHIYIYEEMDSHLYRIVRANGQEVDRVDILSAEGIANCLSKQGYIIRWVDKFPSQERKHVRNLISQYSISNIGPPCSIGIGV